MGLFGKKKTVTKSTYRRKTDEEIDKQLTRKEKQWARDKLLEKAKDNPELENKYIAKLMGIEVETQDPLEQQKQAIKSRIVENALKAIEKDPELAQRFTNKQIEELVGPGADDGSEGDYMGEDESPLTQAVRQLRELRELEGELGVEESKGGGWTSLLKDPDVVKAIFGFLAANAGGGVTREPQIQQVRTYIVSVNGEPREVSEAQYKQLMQQNQIRPMAALAPPEVAKLPEIKPPVTQPIGSTPVSADLSPEQTLINLIGKSLDYTPEEFVVKLQEQCLEGSPTFEQSNLIMSFLQSATYDGICDIIKVYKDDERVKVYVEKVMAGKEWVEKVLKLLQEPRVEG